MVDLLEKFFIGFCSNDIWILDTNVSHRHLKEPNVGSSCWDKDMKKLLFEDIQLTIVKPVTKSG